MLFRKVFFFTRERLLFSFLFLVFLPGIAGCVEHTQALMKTLLDAKQNAREIVVTWLNLAYVYESAAWYNIPSATRKLILNYYDELFVRVKTQEWASD